MVQPFLQGSWSWPTHTHTPQNAETCRIAHWNSTNLALHAAMRVISYTAAILLVIKSYESSHYLKLSTLSFDFDWLLCQSVNLERDRLTISNRISWVEVESDRLLLLHWQQTSREVMRQNRARLVQAAHTKHTAALNHWRHNVCKVATSAKSEASWVIFNQ